MHIGIDVREASKTMRTGKGQWTHGFVEELSRRGIRVTLCTDAALPTEWDKYIAGWDSARFGRGILWHARVAVFLARSRDLDAYVSPTSTIVPALLGRHFPCIPVVHDLIAFRREPHNRSAQCIERLTLPRAIRHARGIVTISESTKDDLLARFPMLAPERVCVVFAGTTTVPVSDYSPDGRTILCIATLCPRKNQLRLIQAYASLSETLRSQYPLILAGSRGWQDRDILRAVRETAGVTWKAYVPEEEYHALLRTATVFALPSLYEGFGLQILDALRFGIPVLTSARGSIPEVTGSAAVLVDPEDVSSIAHGLASLLSDASLRSRLSAGGRLQAERFSWKRTVDLFLEGMGNFGVAR